jgi:transcriptional regulator with XRE-family HTH domain
MNTIGDRIKELRKLRGLSQEKLARLTDLGQSHINHLENGKRRVNTDHLTKLAAALGVPISAFMVDGGDLSDVVVKSANTPIARGYPSLGHVNPLTGKIDLRGHSSRDGITQDQLDGSSVVVMPDGSMEPRYYDGQKLLVNPDYPIVPGSTVLLEFGDGSGLVRELVSKQADEWVVKTYKPVAEQTIVVTDIKRAWLVIAAFEI